MKLRHKVTYLVVVVATMVSIWVLSQHILGPRVVAHAVTPDGFELCVIQHTSWHKLPWLSTSFVVRQHDGPWTKYYYSHEDYPWIGSEVSLDTNIQTATFYRRNKRGRNKGAIEFGWGSRSYTNIQRRRTYPPVQMASDWSPY